MPIKPLVVQKISDHGTENPIVARLSLQTQGLLQWCGLSPEKKEEVFGIYCTRLQRRLLKCSDIVVRLKKSRDQSISNVASVVEQGAHSAPFVISLQDELETFLFEAKLFLRDTLNVINVFFGTTFNEASAFIPIRGKKDSKSRLVSWGARTLGSEHPFVKMLSTEEYWISDIINSRNAVEHPGGHSGTLMIENFKITPVGLTPPTWTRVGNEPCPSTFVFHDLDVFQHNMLTFAEDILLCGIKNHPIVPHLPVVFFEIPKRNATRSAPFAFVGQSILPSRHPMANVLNCAADASRSLKDKTHRYQDA
jgi:hypothetical protein